MAAFDLGLALVSLVAPGRVPRQDVDRAAREFGTCVALAPDLPAGHYGMRRVHSARALTDAAANEQSLSSARAAVVLCPDDAFAHFELGEALDETHEQAHKVEALAEYEKAVELDPEMEDALFRAASLRRIRGDFPEAIRLYERVIALEPTSPWARDAGKSIEWIHKQGGHLGPPESKPTGEEGKKKPA